MLRKIFTRDEFGDSPAELAVAAFAIVAFVVAIASLPTY